MSRVYLFVQNGAGRPKAFPVRRTLTWNVVAREIWKGSSTWFTPAITAETADRWWLVECENAEAGRIVIDHGGEVALRKPGEFLGRILASGGKHD